MLTIHILMYAVSLLNNKVKRRTSDTKRMDRVVENARFLFSVFFSLLNKTGVKL
jgi:hypothetical protein